MYQTFEQIKPIIEEQLASHPVVLYMKGTPDYPQCGFSKRAVNLLEACHAPFLHVDILAEPAIRQHLPKYANWPTFPQLYIQGELIGGSDIMLELFEQGELQKLLQVN